jgi:sigma-E factor negative regulatory protein RseC
MIEEIGVICAIEQHESQQVVIVETQIKSTCGSCEAQSNCGTGAIAKVFASKRETLRFRLNDMVEVGQKVSLGIPEENLLKASAMVYCLPLFCTCWRKCISLAWADGGRMVDFIFGDLQLLDL